MMLLLLNLVYLSLEHFDFLYLNLLSLEHGVNDHNEEVLVTLDHEPVFELLNALL